MSNQLIRRVCMSAALLAALAHPAASQDVGLHVITDHYLKRSSLNIDYGRNIGFGARFFGDSPNFLRGYGAADILWKGLGKYSEQAVFQMPLQLGLLVGPTETKLRPFGELAYMCLFKIGSLECMPVMGAGGSVHLRSSYGGFDPYVEYQRTTNGVRSTLAFGVIYVMP